MALRQPLILQSGDYLAVDDRALLGGFVAAGGDQLGTPRAGVRPFGTDAVGAELSLLVSGGMVNTGAAFVPSAYGSGEGGSGPDSLYLVVNDAPMAVPAGDGVLMLVVVDEWAEGSAPVVNPLIWDGEAPPLPVGDAFAEFRVVPADDTTTVGLPLASVAGGVVTDARVFTSSLGGTFQVASVDELAVEPLLYAPLGSSVYAQADGMTYLRTKRGWESLGQVQVGTEAERPLDTEAFTGMTYYDKGKGLWQTYAPPDSWVTVGVVPPIIRPEDGNPSGRRHVARVWQQSFQVRSPSDGVYRPLSALTTVTNPKPGDAQVEVRLEVRAANTLVWGNVAVEIGVYKATDGTKSVHMGSVALELLRWDGAAWVKVPEYPFLDWGPTAYTWAGLRNPEAQDLLRGRMVPWWLGPGSYRVRPMFSGYGNEGYDTDLRIESLTVEAVA